MAAFNVGDGPAPFLVLAVGTLVVVGAVWLQLARSPPLWLHALIWPPVILVATIGLLRLAKGALLAIEYQERAAEHRIP